MLIKELYTILYTKDKRLVTVASGIGEKITSLNLAAPSEGADSYGNEYWEFTLPEEAQGYSCTCFKCQSSWCGDRNPDSGHVTIRWKGQEKHWGPKMSRHENIASLTQ